MSKTLKDGLCIYMGGIFGAILFSVVSPFLHIHTGAYSYLLDGEIQEPLFLVVYRFGLISVLGFSLVFFPIVWLLFLGICFLKKKWNPNYKLLAFSIFFIIFFLFISMDFFGSSSTGPIN